MSFDRKVNREVGAFISSKADAAPATVSETRSVRQPLCHEAWEGDRTDALASLTSPETGLLLKFYRTRRAPLLNKQFLIRFI